MEKKRRREDFWYVFLTVKILQGQVTLFLYERSYLHEQNSCLQWRLFMNKNTPKYVTSTRLSLHANHLRFYSLPQNRTLITFDKKFPSRIKPQTKGARAFHIPFPKPPARMLSSPRSVARKIEIEIDTLAPVGRFRGPGFGGGKVAGGRMVTCIYRDGVVVFWGGGILYM